MDDMEEAGVGEGVAKEFLVDVLKAGFDPALGLFAATTDGTLYPNPAAPLRVPDAIALYECVHGKPTHGIPCTGPHC